MRTASGISAFRLMKRRNVCDLWQACTSRHRKSAPVSTRKGRKTTKAMQVNFTRVPNRILLALITLDLTKRQIKIICLVLRLTYGCQVPWAFYEKKYFRVAGLHRSAIGLELNQLRELRVLDMDEDKKIVRVNRHTEDWQCSQNSNIY